MNIFILSFRMPVCNTERRKMKRTAIYLRVSSDKTGHFLLDLPLNKWYSITVKKSTKEGKNMKRTTYTFKKDGKAYSAAANNRFDAQEKIELAFGIDLEGATFEEVYKLRVVRTGKVR